MKPKQLNEILELHSLWLKKEGGERADLSEANLSEANLSEANLSEANLRGANLSEANLYGANLSGADLRGADLSGADLYGAGLSGANLSGADLSGANLSRANLSRANLYGANLYGAIVPMFCKWYHGIVDGQIKVGCVTKSPEEWEAWLASDDEYNTKRGTQDFKQIEAVIRAYIAYLKALQ